MKKELIEEVLKYGVVDTNRYRYYYRKFPDRTEIIRLDMSNGNWKIAKTIREENTK